MNEISPERRAYFAYVKEMMTTQRYVELLANEGKTITSDEFKRGAFGSYQPSAYDIIVTTYPKSGTNWTMQMAQEIAWYGEAEYDYIHDVIPWPDKAIKTPVVPLSDTRMAERSPTGYRVIKSHLEAAHVPYSDAAKYIIVVRDPKEVIVSGFHFENGFYEKMVGDVVPLVAYVEGFLTGNFMYDSWAVHTAGWWDLRNAGNVLLLFYPEMKVDPARAIQKIADIMEVTLSSSQFARVAEKSSYTYMKANNHLFSPPTPPDYPVQGKVEMVRRGDSGQAQSELSAEQQRAIDKFCAAELERLESNFPYTELFAVR